MGKLLTADELEGAKPLLSAGDLEGARATRVHHEPNATLTPEERERRRAKSEINDLETGPLEVASSPIFGTSMLGRALSGYPGGMRQDVIGREAKRLQKIDDDNRRAEMFGNVAGQVVGSAVVPVGEGIGAPIGRKLISSLAGKEAGRLALPTMENAISNTLANRLKEAVTSDLMHNIPFGKTIQTVAGPVVEPVFNAVANVVVPTAAAAAAAAPPVLRAGAIGAGAGAAGVLHSNADDSRAQAARFLLGLPMSPFDGGSH